MNVDVHVIYVSVVLLAHCVISKYLATIKVT